MSYSFFVIGDSWDHSKEPVEQNGYTSRVAARLALALQRDFGVEPHFYGATTDYDKLMKLSVPERAVCFLIRNQVQQKLDVALRFFDGRALLLDHFADPHSEYTRIVPLAEQNPSLVERAELQQLLMLSSDIVVASSARKLDIAAQYGQAVFIPDCMDAETLSPANRAPRESARRTLRLLTLGYPFHMPSFALAAEEVLAYRKESHLDVELTVCTKMPNASQAVSHAPAVGNTSEARLRDMASPGGPIRLVEYDARTAQRLMREHDAVVIVAEPAASLNRYQSYNYNLRGASRVVDSLANGTPVIVTVPWIHSYRPFVEAGAITVSDTLRNGIAIFQNKHGFERVDSVQRGQALLLENTTPRAVAAKYHQLICRQFGL